MHGLVTLVVAAVVSGFSAGVVQVGIGIANNAQEELIVAMVAQIVLVLFAAVAFGIAMLASGRARAIDWTAIALVVLIVAALALLESFTLASDPLTQFSRDLPVLVEFGIPALLTVLLQWWIVRRHIINAGRAALAAA